MQETRELFKQHNVFLCPSKHATDADAEGGSPVVLPEAMAAGLICVGTNHCDILEVIINDQTRFLNKEGRRFGHGGHFALDKRYS
jgi:colanic acid/amylovoran biosynthesis glycosyltransferase